MEPPNPYVPDRFLKQVGVTEEGNTARVRYDVADFTEFRWTEPRFGGWEKSKGLRFRVKIDIRGTSKGGMFLFVYIIFDNDPWTGQWAAKLQCTFRVLSQEGKKDLVSNIKTRDVDNTNCYVVAAFPVEELRKKGSGLITNSGTVRLQMDIEWEKVVISNSYDQLLQYREDVKVGKILAEKEREELLHLRDENHELREQLEKLKTQRTDHMNRVDVIMRGHKAAEAYMNKLRGATEELLRSYTGAKPEIIEKNQDPVPIPRRPVRGSRDSKSSRDSHASN